MNYVKTLAFFLGWLAIASMSYADNGNAGNNNKGASDLDGSKPMAVYKSPTCGCCGDWVDYMKSADFAVRIHHPNNLNEIKKQLGVSPRYQSCHTGIKNGYFFEGHIPAEVVKHFLEAKPDAVAGLAVPGMPMGSPGMDVSGRYRPYEVVKIHKDGSSQPYARVSADAIVYLEAP
ncbi:MAG: hypothetical protein ACI82Z_000425 [Cellvibrionaceae bacterium]|jgi:hypothetical protein